MIEKNNLFDQIRETPMADLSVVERLEGLEPNLKDLGPITPRVVFTVDYFWHFPDERIRSKITLGCQPVSELVYLYAQSNSRPKFKVELVLWSGTYSYFRYDSKGRKKQIKPEKFWRLVEFILNTEEGNVAKDGVLGHS